jgi:hypothetical protein
MDALYTHNARPCQARQTLAWSAANPGHSTPDEWAKEPPTFPHSGKPVAAILRAPIPATRKGGNPGYEVKRLRERIAALEAEIATLRASHAPRMARVARQAPSVPTATVDALRASYMDFSPFLRGTVAYEAAKDAYSLAAFGTTADAKIRRILAQGIRTTTVEAGEVPAVRPVLQEVQERLI